MKSFIPRDLVIFLIIGLLLFSNLSVLIAQHQEIIPMDRRVEWEKAGLEKDSIKIENVLDAQQFGVVANDSVDDTKALRNIIDKASQMQGITIIKLPSGQIDIRASIKIPSKVVLDGKGPQWKNKSKATLIYYKGSIEKPNHVFFLSGKEEDQLGVIKSYQAENKSIKLTNDLQVENVKYVLVQPHVGENISNIKGNYVGRLVKVSSIDANTINLSGSLDLTWELHGRTRLGVYRINPVVFAGLQDVTIKQSGGFKCKEYTCKDITQMGNKRDMTGCKGHFVTIKYAYNSWVRNVEGIKPVQNHVNISSSTHIEIKNSYFREAVKYEGAYGYGVTVSDFTSMSLIENNIMSTLRHAILIQHGANQNVYGYNYTRQNSHQCDEKAGDISIHGHYPYANLLEGNIVDRIKADDHFYNKYGKYARNGPFNTLLRNYDPSNYMVLKQIDSTNVLGNEAQLMKWDGSEKLIDIYGLRSNSANDAKTKYASHIEWTENYEKSYYLPVISLYYDQKPEFLKDSNWPPVGPPSVKQGTRTGQSIRALKNYQAFE